MLVEHGRRRKRGHINQKGREVEAAEKRLAKAKNNQGETVQRTIEELRADLEQATHREAEALKAHKDATDVVKRAGNELHNAKANARDAFEDLAAREHKLAVVREQLRMAEEEAAKTWPEKIYIGGASFDKTLRYDVAIAVRQEPIQAKDMYRYRDPGGYTYDLTLEQAQGASTQSGVFRKALDLLQTKKQKEVERAFNRLAEVSAERTALDSACRAHLNGLSK